MFKSFGATKSVCEIYINPTSYYDFKDVEHHWMMVVTHQLKSLTYAYIASGKAETESQIYEMIAKKSGIKSSNVHSHFAGRLLANLKFASATSEVFGVDVDYILAKDFFDDFFKENFVINEYHFDGIHHRLLSKIINFLYWNRASNPLNVDDLKACLKSCSTEMLLEELKRRGLNMTDLPLLEDAK